MPNASIAAGSNMAYLPRIWKQRGSIRRQRHFMQGLILYEYRLTNRERLRKQIAGGITS